MIFIVTEIMYSGRINKKLKLIKIASGHLDLDNNAVCLLALHPLTPTEMESL